MNKTLKKTIKIVLNVIFYIFIAVLLVFSVMNIRAGNKGDNFPNIFGRGFLVVESDSMSYNDKLSDDDVYFEVGDLIHVKTASDYDKTHLHVGDVITFYDHNLKALNSHKIVYIPSGEYKNVFTQGNKAAQYRPFDTVNLENNYLQNDYEEVALTDIRGVYTGKTQNVGGFIDWLSEPNPAKGGFLYIVVLPAIIFLIYEIVLVVLNVISLKNSKNKENSNKELEDKMSEIEEQIRAKVIAELEASKDSKDKEKK